MFFPCIITTSLYSLDKCNSCCCLQKLCCLQISLNNSKTRSQLYFEDHFQIKEIDWKHVIFYHVDFLWIQTYVFFNKILNVLYLNKKFFRFNRISWPLCSFCQFENETPIHLSPGCIKTNLHWYKLKNL